jgi:hypothetical protein
MITSVRLAGVPASTSKMQAWSGSTAPSSACTASGGIQNAYTRKSYPHNISTHYMDLRYTSHTYLLYDETVRKLITVSSRNVTFLINR